MPAQIVRIQFLTAPHSFLTSFGIPVQSHIGTVPECENYDAHHSSERKKSLQSARSISLTDGSNTIELIGRFWRAPFHLQQPYELGQMIREDTNLDRGNPGLTCLP